MVPRCRGWRGCCLSPLVHATVAHQPDTWVAVSLTDTADMGGDAVTPPTPTCCWLWRFFRVALLSLRVTSLPLSKSLTPCLIPARHLALSPAMTSHWSALMPHCFILGFHCIFVTLSLTSPRWRCPSCSSPYRKLFGDSLVPHTPHVSSPSHLRRDQHSVNARALTAL